MAASCSSVRRAPARRQTAPIQRNPGKAGGGDEGETTT